MTSIDRKEEPVRGAQHEELLGGSGVHLRFRPERFAAGEAALEMTCSFRHRGQRIGPVQVHDISSAGIGLRAAIDPPPAPGAVLEDLAIAVCGTPVWMGAAEVVHVLDAEPARIGAQFVSETFDLSRLHVHRRVETSIRQRLASIERQRHELPVEWRAAVSELRFLLSQLKEEIDDIERAPRAATTSTSRRDERLLFQAVFQKWGTVYLRDLAALHEMSKQLEASKLELARAYASAQLLPLLLPCPMHRRAFEKPQGYAGDYHLMTLYFTDAYDGASLWARFLHYVSQRYTLGRTVVKREECFRKVVTEVVSQRGTGPVRILSLACGPALEIRRFIAETARLERPVELVMFDQDTDALHVCHEEISRLLIQPRDLPITLECLHFSVKQFLKPRNPSEEHVVQHVLRGLDLVYSSGLFDYMPDAVASALIRKLYASLKPAGRLYVGNLKEAPDTTWIMEFVLAWHLLYRTRETMLPLAAGLSPAPARTEVSQDDTGNCLFLDVVRS